MDILEPIAVVQTADGYEALSDAEIDPETDAVMVDGEVVPEAKIVTQQYLPLYPQASQVAPKQAGTNGGGIVGTNSAHPFENPNALTNLFEMTLLLLIPVALCFSFGKCVRISARASRFSWPCLSCWWLHSVSSLPVSRPVRLSWHRTALCR